MYWESAIISRMMLTDRVAQRAELENAAILISDLRVEDPRDLVPLLEAALTAGLRRLLIVAGHFSDAAIALLLNNNTPNGIQSIAVKAPGLGVDQQAEALQDLAILTGGRPVLQAAGQLLSRTRLEDLGRARRVWADPTNFGIVGGRGDPRTVRAQIMGLRGMLDQYSGEEQRKRLQQRIAKLVAGSATLWLGGMTDAEIAMRKENAERTARTLRAALREGVVPGGGSALMSCRSAIHARLRATQDHDARAAYSMLLTALEAPLRTIIANAGHDPNTITAEIEQATAGYGFDVRSRRIVDMREMGILDVASVQRAAVRGAISVAIQALSVDVLVQRSNPDEAHAP
jgi:chaperonin GroEL